MSDRNVENGDAPRLVSIHTWRSRWFLKIAVEVALISVGVFLALMGEQWRERAHARQLARESLQRFRVELVRNRKSIEAVKDYHKSLRDRLQQYLNADPQQRGRAGSRAAAGHLRAHRVGPGPRHKDVVAQIDAALRE